MHPELVILMDYFYVDNSTATAERKQPLLRCTLLAIHVHELHRLWL
jgi:hypothetical protein